MKIAFVDMDFTKRGSLLFRSIHRNSETKFERDYFQDIKEVIATDYSVLIANHPQIQYDQPKIVMQYAQSNPSTHVIVTRHRDFPINPERDPDVSNVFYYDLGRLVDYGIDRFFDQIK